MMSIGLYLLGKKGLQVLYKLCEKQYIDKVRFVVVGEDKNILEDYSKEIVQICQKHKIKVFKRNDITIPKSTIQFAIGWKWIIDDCNNLIVLHDSLLPKYRGFNPLVTALLNEDEEVGVTAIKANKEFDMGNIIIQRSISITYPIKINTVIEKVGELYSDIVASIIDLLLNGNLEEYIQNEEEATYSLWRDEDDYFIDWNKSSAQILRFVDSVGFPYKGAKTKFNNDIIRILDVELVKDLNIVNRQAGKFLFLKEGKPDVVCGQGIIRVLNAIYESNGNKVVFSKLRNKFF